MANFLNYIIESTIQPVKTNVLWIKNGIPYYFNKRWKPLLGGGSGIVDSPIIFGDGINNAILKDANNVTNGETSIALGYNLTTNNFAESAFGKYNNSTKSNDPSKATLFSIGNGTSNILKNAFEIKYDNSVYIDGIEKSIQDYLKDLKSKYDTINSDFSNTIIDINNSIKDVDFKLTQTEESIRLEVSQIEESLNNRISENSTQIIQTAEAIKSVAESVLNVDNRVTEQQTIINQTSDKVSSLAIKDEELDNKIQQNTSQIEQTSESINLRINDLTTHVDNLGTQILENKASIELNTNSIKSKVEQSTFDTYSEETSSKFTEIEQTVDSVTTTVQSNSGEIVKIKEDINGLTVKTGTLEADIEALKKQSDGVIDTHFGTAIPTLDNEPAINWTTDELKREHVGDLYYNNVSGEAFRFSYNPETDTYFWVMLSDSALTEALDKISKLEEAIDGKVSIFYTQPSNYKYGDIWFVHNNAYSPYKESSLLTATNIDKNDIITAFNLDHWVLKADIVKSLDDLDAEVTNAFKDKILTSAEVDAIRENKKSFESTFKELSSGHTIIVASTLEDTTSLDLAFSTLESKYTLLIQAINSLILDSDGNLDEALIQNYTNSYNSYLEALKNYSKIKAELTDSIQKNLSSANDYIKDITSDGVLTPIEKKNFLEIWRSFTEEFNTNKGIAVNYKIIDSEGNKRTDIYETDEYYSNYLLYSTAFNDVKSIFESDIFGLSNVTESTKLPTGYSVGDIESSFDNYYNALSIFSEMISKITIEITDAHEKVLQISRELQEQLTPSDSITQIGKGVILSSIIGVQSDGILQAGLNATNIEGLVDDSIDKHGRIILAGGIKGKTNWNEATTVIYEDGHIKINSGEIGEFVEIGSALIKSVVSGKIDLFSYPETINGVTSLIPLFQINKDSTGKIISISTVYDLYVNGNLVISGDVASGGEGEETPAEGTVTGIRVDANTLLEPTAGIIDMTDVFANLDISDQLENYYTRGEVDAKIAGIDFSPYAKTTDVANTYATKTALSTLQSSHDTLRAEFDALDDALNDDVSGKINTWNEIVDFLNEYSGSEDLATIISKINAEIAKRALQSDYTALATRVDAAEGNITSLTNGKADKATTLAGYGINNAYTKTEVGNAISTALASYYTITQIDGKIATINTALDNRYTKTEANNLLKKYLLLEAASQTIKGDITIEGNLVITGDVASGGEGGNTSAEGTVTGVTVSGVDYTSVEAGLLDLTDLMANYALKSASTKVSVSPSLSSGKSIGVISVDGVGTTLYAPATYAWSEIADRPTKLSQFTDDVVSGKYLPLSGGVVDGTLMNPLTIKTSAAEVGIPMFVKNSAKMWVGWNSSYGAYIYSSASSKYLGIKDDGTPHYNGNTLIHSRNYSDYALPLSGGTLTGGIEMGDNPITSASKDVLTSYSGVDTYLRGGSNIYFASPNLYKLVDGTTYPLLHSGNIGGYALKKGAETYRLNIETPLTSNDAEIYAYFQRISADGTNISASDIGSARKGVLRLAGGGSESQLLFDHYNGALYYRNYQTSSWSAWNTLLHSGNVGDYAIYLDKSATGSYASPSKFNTVGYGNGVTSSGWHTIGPILTFGVSGYFGQFQKSYDSDSLFLRSYIDGKFGAWKTIAFTDSNVASATKLQTARTIWGQSFDGTGNVSGALSLGNNSIQGGSSVNMLYYDHSNTLYLGYGMNGVGGSVICGNAIAMRYGNSRTMGLILNSSGNVTIGARDLARTSYKLYVDGYTKCKMVSLFDTDSLMNGYLSLVDNCLKIEATKDREGYKPISLNPSGGNVLIGTTDDKGGKLQVNGYASFKDEIDVWEGTTKNRLTFYEYQGIGRIYSYNETDKTFGDLWIGNNSGDILKVKADGKIGIGTTNPQYKLDVAGTGRFTDSLLVSGTLTANSGATITGDVTINGNLIVSGDVASGGTGQDTPSGGSTSTSGVLTLTGEIPLGSDIPQSSLDAIGLTDQVIADLLIGKYHHVMYTSGVTTYCFVVSGQYNSDYKAFTLHWGDDYMDEFMGYVFALGSSGGWNITIYEI